MCSSDLFPSHDMDEYKRNQYFGDFKTESKYIRLVYRDHLAFDGDRVQILLNDWIIARDILLESEYKSIHMDLKIGFNKVEIIALNQGTSGPNTAEFQVYDDQTNLLAATNGSWQQDSKEPSVSQKKNKYFQYMSQNTTINCPDCGAQIDVNDLLKHQIEDVIRKEYQQKSLKQLEELALKTEALVS